MKWRKTQPDALYQHENNIQYELELLSKIYGAEEDERAKSGLKTNLKLSVIIMISFFFFGLFCNELYKPVNDIYGLHGHIAELSYRQAGQRSTLNVVYSL